MYRAENTLQRGQTSNKPENRRLWTGTSVVHVALFPRLLQVLPRLSSLEIPPRPEAWPPFPAQVSCTKTLVPPGPLNVIPRTYDMDG